MNIEEAQKTISKFVYPIFRVDSELEPELFGSGVFLEVCNKYFVVTASHVIDDLGDSKFYIGDSNKILELKGEFFKTEIDGSNSLFDFAVMEITQEQFKKISGVEFVSLNDCAKGVIDKQGTLYCAHGYPASKNKKQKALDRNNLTFSEYALTYGGSLFREFDYQAHGISINTHVAIRFNQKKVKGNAGQTMTAPKPQGMSGGGLWAYPDQFDLSKKSFVGILIEHHKNDKAILAIRINCVLVLLKKIYPKELANVSES